MPFIGTYEYTIDEDNTIKVYNPESPNENGEPFLLQPHHPEGFVWESAEQAISWLEQHLAPQVTND